MGMKNRFFWLTLVVLLAGFLRLYKLGTNPPSLTWDETAWGYNAYSLGTSGKDEFGRFFPLDYLESFGDFKPPMYAYLDVISVKMFGLNEFAVRFPSAIFGALTVIITFFLVKELFGEAEEFVATISALFLAISPWHINLSRAAFEANVASFFIISGIWLFLKGISKKQWLIPVAIASFTLSLYTFNTARIVSPLILIMLIFAFKEELLKEKKTLFVGVLVGFLVVLPTLKFLFSPQASLRFQEVNIFSDVSVVDVSNQQIKNDNNVIWSKIIHNRRLEYGISYLKHYFDNLNPNFLFVKGDGNPKFSTQDVGQMYFIDIPFFIIGFFVLFKKKRRYWWIIPLWLIIGIIPAATARETPHALRIETTLPVFQILTAVGFVYLIKLISKRRLSHILLTGIIFVFLLNFLYYIHGYYVHYPRIYSGEWQYGYKESIEYVKSVQKNYDRIIVTDKLGRPYIYYLFYTKSDPVWFRNNSDVRRDVFGFVSVDRVGKYYFKRDPNNDIQKNKILYINYVKDVPSGANILKTFYLLNGEPILSAYTI